MSPTYDIGNGTDDAEVAREDKTSPDYLQKNADKAELDARDLEASEAFPIRVKETPIEPSADERAEREISHEPYRSWCRACVAGRGRSDGHFARTNAEKQFPVIIIDYGYLKINQVPKKMY